MEEINYIEEEVPGGVPVKISEPGDVLPAGGTHKPMAPPFRFLNRSSSHRFRTPLVALGVHAMTSPLEHAGGLGAALPGGDFVRGPALVDTGRRLRGVAVTVAQIALSMHS